MDIKLIPESQVSNTNDFTNFKIIIIGDSGVGKSSILKRAVKNTFEENYQATVGFEFLLLYFTVNDFKIKLQIWDTCGQEMYRSLVQGFYRNTSLAVLVYDISNKISYEGLDVWLKDIRSRLNEEVPIFIVGNKSDKGNERKISTDEANDFSTNRRVKYFTECSAKTGFNVDDIFKEVAKYLYSIREELEKDKSSNKLIIGNGEYRKKMKGCCYEDKTRIKKDKTRLIIKEGNTSINLEEDNTSINLEEDNTSINIRRR